MFAILLAAAVAATPTLTVTQAKAAVLAELKDPESARFTDLKPLKGKDGKVTGYCGRVNAKNSYGGYAGASVFYATQDKVVILDPSVSMPSLC